ncbi:MAG: hypothetical protein IT436_00890 [Phycisphaerales bacterium]|nr:hypothetical protein [Phycisphaerales bacterium]
MNPMGPSVRLRRCALALSFAAGPCAAQVEEQRLTPADPLTSDIFGYGIAFDGATLVAGAPFSTFSGVSQPGRAFVFERAGDRWQQTARLLPPILKEGSGFGVQVAVDGDRIAIGAPGEDDLPLTNAGAVYLYERVAGTWTFIQRLAPPSPENSGNFGVAVALRGDDLLIGSNGATHGGVALAGEVLVYHRDAGTWTRTGSFSASDADFDDNFGSSIDFEGDTAVVGAIDDDHSDRADPGAAYIFSRAGGAWTEVDKLIASDPGDGSLFGGCVSINGGTVIVGAERHDHSGLNEAGAAYVFRAGAGGEWAEAARLVSPAPEAVDRFGCDVAVRGQTVLVGAHLANPGTRVGAAYIYRETAGAWSYDRTLTASDGGNTNFGWRLAVAGDRAAIAGPFYQTNRGAVYMFTGLHACRADFTGDGVVDFADYLDFLNLYDSLDPRADLSGDGVVDFADYLEFLNFYDAGC